MIQETTAAPLLRCPMCAKPEHGSIACSAVPNIAYVYPSIVYSSVRTDLPMRCATPHCTHPASVPFEYAPGHYGGLICDCCIKKIWEETLQNVTKSLRELKVQCPPRQEKP